MTAMRTVAPQIVVSANRQLSPCITGRPHHGRRRARVPHLPRRGRVREYILSHSSLFLRSKAEHINAHAVSRLKAHAHLFPSQTLLRALRVRRLDQACPLKLPPRVAPPLRVRKSGSSVPICGVCQQPFRLKTRGLAAWSWYCVKNCSAAECRNACCGGLRHLMETPCGDLHTHVARWLLIATVLQLCLWQGQLLMATLAYRLLRLLLLFDAVLDHLLVPEAVLPVVHCITANMRVTATYPHLGSSKAGKFGLEMNGARTRRERRGGKAAGGNTGGGGGGGLFSSAKQAVTSATCSLPGLGRALCPSHAAASAIAAAAIDRCRNHPLSIRSYFVGAFPFLCEERYMRGQIERRSISWRRRGRSPPRLARVDYFLRTCTTRVEVEREQQGDTSSSTSLPQHHHHHDHQMPPSRPHHAGGGPLEPAPIRLIERASMIIQRITSIPIAAQIRRCHNEHIIGVHGTYSDYSSYADDTTTTAHNTTSSTPTDTLRWRWIGSLDADVLLLTFSMLAINLILLSWLSRELNRYRHLRYPLLTRICRHRLE